MDRYTGVVTRLFVASGIDNPSLIGLAIDGNGRMFSIEQNSNSLVEIDKTAGAMRLVGPLGDESVLLVAGPLAFDRAIGARYMAGATADLLGGLYSVDLDTGHASLVGTIGEDQQLVDALGIATAGGPCVNAIPAPWLSFAPTTGAVAPGDSETISVNLDATGLTGERTKRTCACAATIRIGTRRRCMSRSRSATEPTSCSETDSTDRECASRRGRVLARAGSRGVCDFGVVTFVSSANTALQ